MVDNIIRNQEKVWDYYFKTNMKCFRDKKINTWKI